jgi:hypothetical protein
MYPLITSIWSALPAANLVANLVIKASEYSNNKEEFCVKCVKNDPVILVYL